MCALGPHQLPLSCSPPQHVVRPPHVDADLVELADRHGVDEFPGRGLVVGDVEAPVVADDHMIAVLRINPDRMVVRCARAPPPVARTFRRQSS